MASSSLSIEELNDTIKQEWPKSLPSESWYLGLIATLITCSKLDVLHSLYTHILTTSHTSPQSRIYISNRIKDLIMKHTQIVGIPLTILAVVHLAKAEVDAGMPVLSREEQELQSYYSSLNAEPSLDERGETAMRALYKSNLDPIMAMWRNHQVDYEWFEKRIIYGLFLSDYKFLSPVETEVVVLSGIMCQGLDSPTRWHIRGMRRLDVSLEDTEQYCVCIKKIARWAGKDTSSWVMAKDVDMTEE